MIALQMLNMFGAVRPKPREKLPYSDLNRTTIPTVEEAKSVLSRLSQVAKKSLDDTDSAHHQRVISILEQLTRGNSQDFLSLSENDFFELNHYIGQTLARQQIALVEQQAKEESDDFVEQNAGFFDHLREEGLNYDHLSEEQVQVMKLRLRERSLADKMENNAEKVDGQVMYQYEVGPDERYYKAGGIVMAGETKQVDSSHVKDIRSRHDADDLSGQFADIDALKMPDGQIARKGLRSNGRSSN